MSGDVRWTAEEVAERERLMRHQTARELTQSLAGLTGYDPAPSVLANLKEDPSVDRDLEELAKLRGHNLTPRQKATGRIRQPKGPNKTEKRYWQHLEAQKMAGVVIWCDFECSKLKLGSDCWFTPDFMVWLIDGSTQYHEVKGRRANGKAYYEDDARVKIAAAAKQYPMYKFLMVWPGKAGEWESREF